ncbi:HAD hydrolase-like protein [Rhodopila sp.]|uniref:HAD hydrolase-like protein n=1 Tax=Rhodopila sp. TaxID=2480087 RepID=UPI002C98664D|nr:HAD hydrolase-like protein [Rhodopila sp.]HVZ09202.1 HAD hydrolase-like protein [Rhodopila sp.]
MSKPPAILLDLDGTLADSRAGIEGCFKFMLSALGHDPATAGDLTELVGPPIAVSIRTLLGRYGDDRIDLGLRTYRAHYSEVALYDVAAFPGIGDMLATLRASGRRLCVATAKRRDFAERVVAYLGFSEMLPTVYGALPGGGLDDKKDLIAELLRAEGYDPAGTIMVGDRHHDIHAAQANGLRAIGVLWGYGGEAELRRAGADMLANAPVDVARLVAA